jgi:hypothetical protein
LWVILSVLEDWNMKYLFLATSDNKMQLLHLLLNANNYIENGYEVAVIMECASPKLLVGLADGSIRLPIFTKSVEKGIIDHACKACSATFGATESAMKLGVPVKGELNGHSNLLEFSEKGYSIISF